MIEICVRCFTVLDVFRYPRVEVGRLGRHLPFVETLNLEIFCEEMRERERERERERDLVRLSKASFFFFFPPFPSSLNYKSSNL